MNEIKINLVTKLNKLSYDMYEFKTELNYRIGYNDDEGLYFVDPSGGPFITIGSVINNRKVVGIYKDKTKILIALEHDISSNK